VYNPVTSMPDSRQNSPKTRPRNSQKLRDHVSAYLFISPFFIIFGVFTLFPILWSAYISFFKWNIIGVRQYIGLKNYAGILTNDPLFWQSVGNTFSMWVMSTIPQLFLALILANVLNSNSLKGRKLFRISVIVPNITSLVAVAAIFGSLFGYNYGLINWFWTQLGYEKFNWGASYWGAQIAVSVMVIWRWTGYNALIYLTALQGIPADLYEAARIDGASGTQQFFHITIPMIRPILLFTVIISTIGGMQIFIEPLIFSGSAGGPQSQTLTMVMYLYNQAFTNNSFGYAAAVAWMLFLIIIVFSLFNSYITRKINSTD
jgi:cellobiose transport system permease protein